MPHPPQSTLGEIGRRRVSAILRTNDTGTARSAMSAAVAGGFGLIEFTLTTPGAVGLIAEFSRRPELLVGAGTVLTRDQARAAVRAGARFLVSPVCDAEIIAEARALEVVAIPGTFTPSEMLAAHRLGAEVVKLFPSPGNLPEYVSSVLGPLPQLRIFPTAGVNAENFLDILRAGAFGVGFVRSLFDPAALARGDYSSIQARAEEIHRRLASAT
jgi:2-dehydro-3-deoxyphosphogluconate aldolase/(4S)-4-hydroxy-2-oxoglutarate aldolase